MIYIYGGYTVRTRSGRRRGLGGEQDEGWMLALRIGMEIRRMRNWVVGIGRMRNWDGGYEITFHHGLVEDLMDVYRR